MPHMNRFAVIGDENIDGSTDKLIARISKKDLGLVVDQSDHASAVNSHNGVRGSS